MTSADEECFFIAKIPPMPPAGQIPTCWGPYTAEQLEEEVAKFHLEGLYHIYSATAYRQFTVATGIKTEVSEL